MAAVIAAQDDMDIDLDFGNDPTYEADHIAADSSDDEGEVAEGEVDPNAEIVPTKIHIRGVDELASQDVLDWVRIYFPDPEPKLQWIDDTSLNLEFADSETANAAFAALSAPNLEAANNIPHPLIVRPAQPFTSRPMTQLSLRMAMETDKKAPRARDASRFYLLHPEHDPSEKRYQERRNGRGDDRRRRRRDSEDDAEPFEASMYDDHDATQEKTQRRRMRRLDGSDTESIDGDQGDVMRKRPRRRSASPGRNRNGYRERERSPGSRHTRDENKSKELFPSRSKASGMRTEGVPGKAATVSEEPVRDLFPLRATSSLAATQRELFPTRAPSTLQERISSIPQNGSAFNNPTNPGTKSLSLEDRINQPRASAASVADNIGFSILGASRIDQGMSIRGSAGERHAKVKELFPSKAGMSNQGNQGKELFAERFGPRKKATEFY